MAVIDEASMTPFSILCVNGPSQFRPLFYKNAEKLILYSKKNVWAVQFKGVGS